MTVHRDTAHSNKSGTFTLYKNNLMITSYVRLDPVFSNLNATGTNNFSLGYKSSVAGTSYWYTSITMNQVAITSTATSTSTATTVATATSTPTATSTKTTTPTTTPTNTVTQTSTPTSTATLVPQSTAVSGNGTIHD